MPQRCCVPGCFNTGGHTFPKDPIINLKWRVAIKRSDSTKSRGLWTPGKHDVVCHWHFCESDYLEDTSLGVRERGRLKKGTVPSIFPFRELPESSPRLERLNKRTERLLTQEKENAYECKENDVQYEVELPNDSKESLNEFEYLATPLFHQKEVQCSLPVPGKYSIDNFRFDDKSVKYYTGFSTYEHFMFLFHCLGQAAYELTYQCSSLEPKDQLFLTIMKLRCAKDDIELSIHFKISESTVSRIFTTWINFLFFQLQEIDIWPSRKLIDQHMPSDFKKKFPRTRVILDATEFPIQKPSDVNLQSATWSAYKHRNTIKTMIGCSPRGAVSFVSDTFCGSVSDRQIIENSDLLNKASTFEKNDSIMADRGIMVQDLFATRDVMVNTPTMLKGKSQLEPSEIVHDRRVASKRIHIERVIGLSKKYKILKQELPHSKLPLGNRIVSVFLFS